MVVSWLRWANWGRSGLGGKNPELSFGQAEFEIPPVPPRGEGECAVGYQQREKDFIWEREFINGSYSRDAAYPPRKECKWSSSHARVKRLCRRKGAAGKEGSQAGVGLPDRSGAHLSRGDRGWRGAKGWVPGARGSRGLDGPLLPRPPGGCQAGRGCPPGGGRGQTAEREVRVWTRPVETPMERCCWEGQQRQQPGRGVGEAVLKGQVWSELPRICPPAGASQPRTSYHTRGTCLYTCVFLTTTPQRPAHQPREISEPVVFICLTRKSRQGAHGGSAAPRCPRGREACSRTLGPSPSSVHVPNEFL